MSKKNSLKWNKVTPLSKCLAMALFVFLPFFGFFLGMKYQQSITIEQPIIVNTVNNSKKIISQINYQCRNGKHLQASYYEGPTISVTPGNPPQPNGEVKLVLSDGRKMTLPQTISADGTRYATNDESIIFWSKGKTVFIIENNVETFSDCSQQ